MALTAGVALGTGLAAAGGATAAAVRAARMKAQPRQSTFGMGKNPAIINTSARPYTPTWQESAAVDAANPYQVDFNQNRAAAQGTIGTGLGGLQSGSAAAEQQRLLGMGLIGGQQGAASGREGANILAGYQPGAVSGAMGQQMLNQNAQANLGAARSGGALGLRNALNANAQAGVSASGQIAQQAAQEQQQYLAARLGQADADRQARLAQQAQGISLAGGALGQGLQASNAYTSAGLGQEARYLDAESDLQTRQLAADMDYDRRRQEEQQRKSNNLWGFAGNLLGVAGKSFGGMGG